MKKLFTLFAGLTMFLSSVLAATETTVYYAVPSSVVGTYTVKLNVQQEGKGQWAQHSMTLTDKTFQGKLIYTCTFTDLWDGLNTMQFQLYDGSAWMGQVEPFNGSWTAASVYNGKMWVHGESSWFDYSYDPDEPFVVLNVTSAKVEPNTLITLTAEAFKFAGEVSYAYSYSTTGAEPFTALAGNTFTPEAVGEYTFKVVATAGEQEASATKVVTVAVVTYTAVGGSTDLFGEEWNPAATANDMVKQLDGTYQWVKEDLILAATTYEYKVAADHAWDQSWPSSGNASFNIAETAKYTVTITFDPANGNLNAEAVKTGSGEKDIEVKIAGDFTNWATNALDMIISADKKTYTLTYTFEEIGVKELKVIEGPTWLGNTGTMTREYCTGWTMTTGDNNNMKLTIDVAGEYTFTYAIETHKLTVTYPTTYSLAIGAAGWATLSLPFAVNIPEDLKAYYVSENNAGTLTLTPIAATDGIPANEGVLIKKLSGESPYEFSGVASATAISGNLLHANLTAGTVAEVAEATQYYKLLNGTHGLGWYLGAEDGGVFTLGANKAYLALSGSQAQVRFVLEDMLNNGYVTALENNAEAVKANKTLVNGQLFILREGKTFDVVGRIVK